MCFAKVCVSSGEEDEEEIFKMRAKLYRYDPGDGTEDNEVKTVTQYDKIKFSTEHPSLFVSHVACLFQVTKKISALNVNLGAVEGTRDGRLQAAETRSDGMDPPGDAAGQDAEAVRQPRGQVVDGAQAELRQRQSVRLERARRLRRWGAKCGGACHQVRQRRERRQVQVRNE